MTLENVLRGTADIGAMVATAWGVRQTDSTRNIIHIENIKPRDFEPCGPFEIIGRPYIEPRGRFPHVQEARHLWTAVCGRAGLPGPGRGKQRSAE